MVAGGLISGAAISTVLKRPRKPTEQSPGQVEHSQDTDLDQGSNESDGVKEEDEIDIESNKKKETKLPNIPIFVLPPATPTKLYSHNLTQYVDGLSATDVFTVVQLSKFSWVDVTLDGMLRGTPPAGTAGIMELIVRVQDIRGEYADVEIRIPLTEPLRSSNQPPVWRT